MDDLQYSKILDLVYGAAVEPALWVAALEEIADSLGAGSAWLSQLSMADGSGSGIIARIDPVKPQLYIDYYGSINPFANKRGVRATAEEWRPSISTDEAEIAKAVLVAGEYYNDFMRPQEVHNVLMINLAAQGDEVATVNINRSAAQGGFEAQDLLLAAQLHPHLIRSFRLGNAFAGKLTLGKDLTAVLDQMVQGICVLDVAGRVLHLNRRAEHILRRCDGLVVVAGRLVATQGAAQRALSAMIAAAGSLDSAARCGGDLLIGPGPGERSLSISVAPLKAETFSIITIRPSVLVCINELAGELSLSDGQMRGLFALTPAEARVARFLLQGCSPADIACRLEVSINTVRTHLARIFDKTGTARQADLSRLFARLAAGSPQG